MLIHKSSIVIGVVAGGLWLVSSVQVAVAETAGSSNKSQSSPPNESRATRKVELERATFGLGCYSCAEAILERLKGVQSVAVGFSGGTVKNPTDEQIGVWKNWTRGGRTF